MTKSSVPMNVWIKTLILFFLFFWGAYTVYYIRNKKGNIRENSLQSKNYSRSERLDLYFMGSSLTNLAMVRQGTLESSFANKKSELSYKIVFKQSAIISDFNNRIKELRNKRPKYLFIESNIICINRNGDSQIDQSTFSYESNPKKPTHRFNSPFYKHKSKLLARISGFFQNFNLRLLRKASKIISSIVPNNKFTPSNSLTFGEKIDTYSWHSYSERVKYYRIRQLHDFPEWIKFFEEAEELGIKIYILDLSRSKKAKTYFSEDFYINEKKLIEQHAIKYGIKYLSFPFNLEQGKFFYDAVHFNKAGANLYCNWLTDVIIEINSTEK